jgi:gamma-glutamylcyclotransferase (GGCT)/AIG2-like uncharacterized protein YtfP
MKDYLFAYGTLANSKVPHEITSSVKQLKHIGDGFIFGRLYDVGEYPGTVLDSDRRYRVYGKIFELPADPKVLERLDAYEAFDPQRPRTSLFVRQRTAITRPNKSTLVGWVYEYNRDLTALPLIENGHYSKASTRA